MMKQKPIELKRFIGDGYVLVVDPSANFRDSIKRFLANMDVTKIKHVSSSADAKREMITTTFSFFIVEWLLPDQNALELCRYIKSKKAYENTPFLLITSENLRSDVVLASEAGIDGYLLKPFAYDDFVTQVTEIVKSKSNPSNLNQVLNDADKRFGEGDLEAAMRLFRVALKIKPKSARALTGLGSVYQGKKELGKAADYFEKAILNNPDFLEAYNLLLDILAGTTDTERYVAVAKSAHRISPDNPRYTLILAHGFFEINELEMSEQYFKKTLLLSPKLAEGYKGLGNVHFEKEQYDKAIKNYKKALDLEASDLSLMNSLGMSYVRKGLISQGIKYYRLALNIDAFDFRILFNLGYAYEKLGDIPKAISNYEKCLASNPDYEKAARRAKQLRQNPAS